MPATARSTRNHLIAAEIYHTSVDAATTKRTNETESPATGAGLKESSLRSWNCSTRMNVAARANIPMTHRSAERRL
jgi:hypothetical protein